MASPDGSPLKGSVQMVLTACKDGMAVIRHRGPSEIQFWFIALMIGFAAGGAAVLFRKSIDWLQALAYGPGDPLTLADRAALLPWYVLIAIPTLGGLAVGVILWRFSEGGRPHSVGEVIEGAAVSDGRLTARGGFASTVASVITLSTGGSTGREGPVVHLAALISTYVCRLIRADGITGRDLLGCAVAAAVSASFNAPIAGALFALEVILRHFAVHAFAPIVIASVAGTVVSRLEFGNVTEFALAEVTTLTFYVELPAFVLLGLLCGLVAVIVMRGIFLADDLGTAVQNRLRLHPILRPVVSGALLGVLAIWFPMIIGVGYGVTSDALTGDLLLHEAMVFVVLKIIALAVTMAGRMGGGVFSPSLMIGALTGLAFGIVATGIFPDVSGSETLYALAGFGAVAAAVLGAPISTTLIVFELTGDWQTGLAVMVSVSLSTAIASRLVHRSFFLTQLERRGVHLAAGPQAYLLAMFRVSGVMRDDDAEDAADADVCLAMIEDGLFVEPSATLEAAMPLFDRSPEDFIPVAVRDPKGGPPELVGALFHIDALKIYNKALAATAAEEHS